MHVHYLLRFLNFPLPFFPVVTKRGTEIDIDDFLVFLTAVTALPAPSSAKQNNCLRGHPDPSKNNLVRGHKTNN